jgi:hypothetical protein
MTLLSGTALFVFAGLTGLAGVGLSLTLYMVADKASVFAANRPEPHL